MKVKKRVLVMDKSFSLTEYTLEGKLLYSVASIREDGEPSRDLVTFNELDRAAVAAIAMRLIDKEEVINIDKGRDSK